MNERIKELTKGLIPVAIIGNWGMVDWADNVFPEFGDKMYADADLEKFAELIVRECAKVSATKAGTFDKDSFVAQRIKEHFGVEE